MKPRLRLEDARAFFAEELRITGGGTSSEVEAAFAHVRRERFLQPPPWRIKTAASFRRGARPVQTSNPRHLYHNVLVALDRDRNNGMPSLWYTHFEALAPRVGERALHAGCGTGYYSAILARLVGRTGSVVAVESNKKLAQRARHNLRDLENVSFVAADATQIDAEVDLIVVSAGVASPPRRWLEMLRPGGRMVIPITGTRGNGASFLLTRERAGIAMAARFLLPVGFTPCDGARDETAARAVDEALVRGYHGIAEVTRVRLDDHPACEQCWLHLAAMCLSR